MPAKTGPPAQYVERMFSRIARRYDFLNTAITLGRHRRWKRAAALAAGKAQGTGPGLDIATGTGDIAFTLSKQPDVTSVLGIDLSRSMIDIARRKAIDKFPDCPVSFLQADALSLPFPHESFVAVTSGFALRNVENVETCVSEMIRVLRPGGRVAVVDLSPVKGWSPLNFLLEIYVRRFIPSSGTSWPETAPLTPISPSPLTASPTPMASPKSSVPPASKTSATGA